MYAGAPRSIERITTSPLELKERSQLTNAELEQLGVIQEERRRNQRELGEERRRLGLDRAMKEGLIQGISFW